MPVSMENSGFVKTLLKIPKPTNAIRKPRKLENVEDANCGQSMRFLTEKILSLGLFLS